MFIQLRMKLLRSLGVSLDADMCNVWYLEHAIVGWDGLENSV